MKKYEPGTWLRMRTLLPPAHNINVVIVIRKGTSPSKIPKNCLFEYKIVGKSSYGGVSLPCDRPIHTMKNWEILKFKLENNI